MWKDCSRPLGRWAGLLAAVAIAGCGGDDDGGGDGDIVSIAIDPPDGTLHAGSDETIELAVTATRSDGSTVAAVGAAWNSSDPDVAAVDSAGVVSAGAAMTGEVTITATVGDLDATAQVSVVPSVVATAIEVTPGDAAIDAGDTAAFVATATYEDGRSEDVSDQVTWTSQPEVVATIDEAGVATGVSIGTATITATLDDLSGDVTLAVDGPALLDLDITGRIRLTAGGDFPFTVTGVYADDAVRDLTSAATWSSSDETIAMVDTSGVVHAVTSGDAVLFASYGGLETSREIAVRTLVSLFVTVDEDFQCDHTQSATQSGPFPVGVEVPFLAIGTYDDDNVEVDNDIVTWSSSSTAIASIDGDGLMTAKAAGTTGISASFGAVVSDQVAGGAPDPLSVSVQAGTLQTISIISPDDPIPNPGEDFLLRLGTSAGFQAIGLYNLTGPVINGFDCDNTRAVAWSTSLDTRMSIDDGGVATAAASNPGPVTVTAAIGGVDDVASGRVAGTCVVGIEILGSPVTTPVGLSVDVDSRLVFSDGSTSVPPDGIVIYESTNEDFFSVDGNGVIQPVAQGYARVNAFDDTGLCTGLFQVEDSLGVTVTAAALQDIDVVCEDDYNTPQDMNDDGLANELPAAIDSACYAVGHFSDGSQADVTPQTAWSSTAPSVATIDDGHLKTIAVGTTVLVATVGNVSGGFTLRVAPTAFGDTIEVFPANGFDAISPPGGFTTQMQAFGLFHVVCPTCQEFSFDITQQATWQSSAMTIASVNDTTAKGVVTTGTTGNASPVQIIARYQPPGAPAERTGVRNFLVPVSTLDAIDVSGPDVIAVGDSGQFAASGFYSYSGGNFDEDITTHAAWSTSNASIAMATAGGLVNALTVGNVQVRAALSGRTGSFGIVVVSD